MFNDHGQVVINKLGKFHYWPLLSAPLVLEQINGCPLLTHLGYYFSNIAISESLISVNTTFLLHSAL